MGGDIEVVITTPADGEPKTYVWSEYKCLRATVTYRDSVDETEETNDPDTSGNETLEGAWAGTERPVKREDFKNDPPVFTITGNPADETDIDQHARRYEADRTEGAFDPDNNPRWINEVFSALDPATGEDDDSTLTPRGPGDDILTYVLSGDDAKYFEIKGSVGDPGEPRCL